MLMLRLQSQLWGKPIISLQTGRKIGELGEPIINPTQLQVAAFYCDAFYNDTISVLYPEDIREINPLGIFVDDQSKLMELDDLVRLEEFIRINYTPLGKIVANKRRKIGKVNDYAIEDEFFQIQKLYVAVSVLRNLQSGARIIDRNQIAEIQDKKIIIKDGEERVRSGKLAPATNS